MIRQCFLRLSSISLLYTLFAVVFSLLITVAAHPVAAAAGDLDTSFDSDGKVTTEVGSTFDFARSVAIQSDGSSCRVPPSTHETRHHMPACVYLCVAERGFAG